MDEKWYKEEYKKYVVPYATGKPYIEVDKQVRDKIIDLAQRIVRAKLSEKHHKFDNKQEFKRFYTGLLGEAALEKMFSIDIIDYQVGSSNYFNTADLHKQNIDIGIKTVELWKFPIIHKIVKRPEIINVRKDEKTVVCFGLATIDVLKKYQNDNYILSPFLKARGTKTGFYGFSELIPINSYDELVKIYQEIT